MNSERLIAIKAPSSSGLLLSRIAGLHYLEDYVSAAGHNALLTAFDAHPWSDDLRRRIRHYGPRYDYKRRSMDRSMALGPLPDWAAELAERLGQEGITPARPDRPMNEYLPGQWIASHFDCEPCFGGVVFALSLGSACTPALRYPFVNRSKATSRLQRRYGHLWCCGDYCSFPINPAPKMVLSHIRF